MSVLIKDMEMPSGCNMCQLRDLCFDYYICRAKKLNDGRYLDVDDVTNRRHRNCPLIEIPTPHGRLIDADKLIAFITNGLNRKENPMGFDAIEILTEIEYAPIIIEAEVSE